MALVVTEQLPQIWSKAYLSVVKLPVVVALERNPRKLKANIGTYPYACSMSTFKG